MFSQFTHFTSWSVNIVPRLPRALFPTIFDKSLKYLQYSISLSNTLDNDAKIPTDL